MKNSKPAGIAAMVGVLFVFGCSPVSNSVSKKAGMQGGLDASSATSSSETGPMIGKRIYVETRVYASANYGKAVDDEIKPRNFQSKSAEPSQVASFRDTRANTIKFQITEFKKGMAYVAFEVDVMPEDSATANAVKQLKMESVPNSGAFEIVPTELTMTNYRDGLKYLKKHVRDITVYFDSRSEE